MGLRSRRRRLLGGTEEEPMDVQMSSTTSATLEDHLKASIRQVDAVNLAWKNLVGYFGFAVALYELIFLYSIVTHFTFPSVLYFVYLKLVALAGILATQQYIQTGQHVFYGLSLSLTAGHLILASITYFFSDGSVSFMTDLAPFAELYALICYGVLLIVGDNTKIEVERAAQLEKLEKVLQDA